MLLALAAVAGPLTAAEVRYFNLQTRRDFLSGTLDGLGLGPLATLRLSDRVELLSQVESPFLFAVARHPSGWVLGTGNQGRVLLLRPDGSTESLLDAAEPEVFALLVEEDGTVYAGTSPHGKVYRIRDGNAEAIFAPEEDYIWALGRADDGALLVATGTNGRLYRLSDSGESEILFDADDPHLRSLLVQPDGRVLVGTAGSGLIVSIHDGGARTLFDSDLPEIVAISDAGDGGFYAAAISSESSLVEARAMMQPSGSPSAREEDESETQNGEPEVTVLVEGATAREASGVTARTRRQEGPRSILLHGTSSGVIQAVERFDEETVHSLLWLREHLWIGTGQEGKLFSRTADGDLLLAKDVDERQVIGLAMDTPGPVFATTNAASLYRITARSERRGVFTSATLDAEQVSRFGRLRWDGESRGGEVAFSFRSGMSAQPDQTWTGWSRFQTGNDLSLEEVPPARYLQVRTRLEAAAGRSPLLRRLTISYLQENLPPRITSLKVLAPGEVKVPRGFNPDRDEFDPARPDESGFFTPISAAEDGEDRTKSLWKLGYRTLVWEAEDPNGDDLVYSLGFRPDGSSQWLPMQTEWEESVYPFDATVLADGVYRFRLTVADAPPDGNGDAAATDVRISEPVTIDNSVPRLGSVRRSGGGLMIELIDDWSPLRRIALSVDAGPWRPLTTQDGLVDGLSERVRITPPEGARLVLLRVEDAAHNQVTFDLGTVGGS